MLWRNILGSQMSKVGTKLTLAVLPQCWNERTFGPISATTQFDPDQTFDVSHQRLRSSVLRVLALPMVCQAFDDPALGYLPVIAGHHRLELVAQGGQAGDLVRDLGKMGQEAAMVVFLFLVGELLEGVAAGHARASIQGLTKLVPKTALVERNGRTEEVEAKRWPRRRCVMAYAVPARRASTAWKSRS